MRIVLRYDKYPCNRQVQGTSFSQMEHIHQKQQGQSIVGHHGHQIVDRRDQRAGGTAGSMWILWNSMGMTVPTRLEITMATTSDTPTQPEIRKAGLQRIALAHMDVDP